MSRRNLTRREFVGGLAAVGAFPNLALGQNKTSERIDRRALVSRHDPILRKFEPSSPLSVGNGEFAFTCDVTGLQTFPELYKDAMPLCTMAQWGWHTTPMPENLKDKKLRLTDYDTYGRKVGYMTGSDGQKELFDWLRENPHRLHLGQIGFDFGADTNPEDITDIEQRLELWTGIIHSRFKFKGEDVYVQTMVDADFDEVAIRVTSDLVYKELLAINIRFPYGSASMQATDWDESRKHKTSKVIGLGSNATVLKRTIDNEAYFALIAWDYGKFEELEDHYYAVRPAGSGLRKSETLDCVISFSKNFTSFYQNVREVLEKNRTKWQNFWSKGSVIDLSGSKDNRAPELERRVVLSQYLTAIQCSGSTPPQETGLTCNSWYGKFHLEMHWWHAAHFALWNRLPMLEKSLGFYNDILASARERARQQGYLGARWPKMTSPDGRDSPSPIGPLLIWQQPHPIFYAELVYRSRPTLATLKKYQAIVFESAEFMASYAHFDAATNRYVLGPPVIPAQENHPPRETWNPTFELEYWRFGLQTANRWRQLLGLKRDAKWDGVVKRLSTLPTKEGVYLAHENCPQTFTERNRDHPSMLAAYGMLTGEMVDRETMRRTLRKVMKEWAWGDTWGWDYPMTAMTAARLGEPEMAIDALLLETPKNHHLTNGHNYQRPNLPCYLPGNGGLLYAVALMANGWKGASERKAPGFPSDGSWTVRSEGFNSALFKQL